MASAAAHNAKRQVLVGTRLAATQGEAPRKGRFDSLNKDASDPPGRSACVSRAPVLRQSNRDLQFRDVLFSSAHVPLEVDLPTRAHNVDVRRLDVVVEHLPRFCKGSIRTAVGRGQDGSPGEMARPDRTALHRPRDREAALHVQAVPGARYPEDAQGRTGDGIRASSSSRDFA